MFCALENAQLEEKNAKSIGIIEKLKQGYLSLEEKNKNLKTKISTNKDDQDFVSHSYDIFCYHKIKDDIIFIDTRDDYTNQCSKGRKQKNG